MTRGDGLGNAHAATLSRMKTQLERTSKLRMQVLMWVSHIKRSSYIDELCRALGVKIESTDLNILNQCSQPSRADGRALAGYSPGRPGQGGCGRPGKASVFHKDGSPMGWRPGPAVLLGTGSAGRARPSTWWIDVPYRALASSAGPGRHL